MVGADTRATGGKTVCDRNCDKIHILASNIACCGAGTSADADRATEVGRGVYSVTGTLAKTSIQLAGCCSAKLSSTYQSRGRCNDRLRGFGLYNTVRYGGEWSGRGDPKSGMLSASGQFSVGVCGGSE